MKLALNGATIMPSPLEDDVDIAASCGYAALEIWAGKLDAYTTSGSSLEHLADLMRAREIAPWSINSIEDITCRDVHGRRALLDELRERVAMATTLGAPSIVVVPSRRDPPVPYREAVADAVDVLRSMSDVAGAIGLAFEFLGKPGCTVRILGMATEIVERVDRLNVGMVIDTFHFHAGGSAFDDLRHVPLEKLFVVHLNGCEDLPLSELTDAHRLYPGEGVIPIGSIVRVLHDGGFDGVASVEIFRPEYWEQDPRQVARTAYERAAKVLGIAGYDVRPAPSAT